MNQARLAALDKLIADMDEDLATSHLPEEEAAPPEAPPEEESLAADDAAALASNMDRLFS